MAHAAIPHNETLTSLKGKVFLYCEALANHIESATDAALKLALLRFKFFPSVSELATFFEEYRASNPDWTPPAGEFDPPIHLAAGFNVVKNAIGPAAYHAWFLGAEAWTKPDGSIHVKAGSAIKARWIRENFADSIEFAFQQPVSFSPEDVTAAESWPHNGPRTTSVAWWQNNQRWPRDVSQPAEVEELFSWR